MQYTEIIKLLDAGYTREEIMQMRDQEDQTDQADQTNQADQADHTAPDPAMNETLEELKTLFSDMKKEFTAMNIMNSRREEDVRTSEDILGSIINPPKLSKKEGK